MHRLWRTHFRVPFSINTPLKSTILPLCVGQSGGLGRCVSTESFMMQSYTFHWPALTASMCCVGVEPLTPAPVSPIAHKTQSRWKRGPTLSLPPSLAPSLFLCASPVGTFTAQATIHDIHLEVCFLFMAIDSFVTLLYIHCFYCHHFQ